MDERVFPRISRARELLKNAKHAAMATVNEDGSPHNTPFYLILDDALQHIYFGSHPKSQHSKNVIRTGALFVVLYEANQAGGLYIKAVNAHKLIGKALEVGLDAHNRTRARDGMEPLSLQCYQKPQPQRMFGADIETLWVNVTELTPDGYISREYRQKVTAKDLLK